MKKKGMPLPLTVAVMTDYTCIPFWEETCCDYYIVPHPELIEECARRGIPKEKMIPFGIPVRKCFRNLMDQEEAKEKLGFSPEKKPIGSSAPTITNRKNSARTNETWKISALPTAHTVLHD